MTAPWNPADVTAQVVLIHRVAGARSTCPDCGSAAQGRGFFGKPYCGLCERSIVEVSLAPVTVLGVGRIAA